MFWDRTGVLEKNDEMKSQNQDSSVKQYEKQTFHCNTGTKYNACEIMCNYLYNHSCNRCDGLIQKLIL